MRGLSRDCSGYILFSISLFLSVATSAHTHTRARAQAHAHTLFLQHAAGARGVVMVVELMIVMKVVNKAGHLPAATHVTMDAHIEDTTAHCVTPQVQVRCPRWCKVNGPGRAKAVTQCDAAFANDRRSTATLPEQG